MCYPAAALRKEKKLWDACYADNIDQVKEITAEEGVNLNWMKPDTSVSDLAPHYNWDGRLQQELITGKERPTSRTNL